MKLDITIDGKATEFELLERGPRVRFRIGDGDAREADVESPEPCVWSILLEGKVYDAHVEPAPGKLIVTVAGHRFEVEAADPRAWRQGGAAGKSGGAEILSAPMPGRVVRVLVQPGDRVETGQGIVVVEAMKMQNEIKAGRAGRVATLHAREGATVAAGEALAVIGE